MTKFKERMLYTLLLVPTVTELMESGTLPSAPRDIITDIVMTVIVLVLVVLFNQKKRAIRELKVEIQNAVRFDPLTRLPTRTQFEEDLEISIEHARRNKDNIMLLCVEIDHLKEVNDQYGTVLGDDLLRELVKRIKSIIPDNTGHLYRVGGDTFAVLFAEEALMEKEKIIADLVTLAASGNKLLETYQSSVTIGTSSLESNDRDSNIWYRAVQDMRKKRQSGVKDINFQDAGIVTRYG